MRGAAVFCFGAEEKYSGAEQGGAGQEAKSLGRAGATVKPYRDGAFSSGAKRP